MVYVEKCIGRLSAKLQLLCLQLVPWTGMSTIACTPVLLMSSCGIHHLIIVVPKAEICESFPGLSLQLPDPSIFMT